MVCSANKNTPRSSELRGVLEVEPQALHVDSYIDNVSALLTSRAAGSTACCGGT